MAKKLLDSKNILYQEININVEKHKKDEMIYLAKGKTSVPQIFFDELHIGGCEELYKLERANKLESILKGESNI
jgi:glutaredoxin 3